MGELAAACIAGVFSLEDGLRLTAERGRLMQALPPNGTMASVRAGADALGAILAELGSDVSIAAVNGPTSTVISGRREAVAAALAETSRRGLRGQLLTVSHAFHSSLMDPMLDELEALAARIHYSAPRIGLVSDVSGQVATAEDFVTAGYWHTNPITATGGDNAVMVREMRGRLRGKLSTGSLRITFSIFVVVTAVLFNYPAISTGFGRSSPPTHSASHP